MRIGRGLAPMHDSTLKADNAEPTTQLHGSGVSGPEQGSTITCAGRTYVVIHGDSGWALVDKQLEDHHGMILKRTHGEPLMVLRLGRFLRAYQCREASQEDRSKTSPRFLP